MQNIFWKQKSPDPQHKSCELTWNTNNALRRKSYSQINFYMLSPRTSYLLVHEAVILSDLSRLPVFIHV